MKSLDTSPLSDIAALFGGRQGEFYSILMGQQLHVGGMAATIDLAERAGIGEGQTGVDLCCGNGAAMRVLVRFRNVASMCGVDLTPQNVERGLNKLREEKLADRIRIVAGDACATGLPTAMADFVWGEDAWCYVPDKEKLVAEAARIVRPGGTIAFTDWVEGPVELSADEAQRALALMNFQNVQDVAGYRQLLEAHHCDVRVGEDTGRLTAFFELSLTMIETQFAYDVLATIQFRTDVLKLLTENLRFLGEMAGSRKMIQARFIAQRRA
jgi:SAM-dependent methyltransferase